MNKIGIFGYDVSIIMDPWLLLIERMLEGKPESEIIEWLTSTLLDLECKDKEMLPFVAALERIFGRNKVVFRAHLWENVYPKLSARNVELQKAVLRQILLGWYPGCEDAEQSFLSICNAFKKGSDGVKKLVSELLREYLEKNFWEALDLDAWIIREDQPWEIASVLAKARMRMLNWSAVREIRFIGHCNPLTHTAKAIEMVQKYMDVVARTESLATQLIDRIVGKPYFSWDLSKTAVSYNNDRFVDYEFISEKTFKVRVALHVRPAGCPAMLQEILDARTEFLSGVENPPEIILSVIGPDGFVYNG